MSLFALLLWIAVGTVLFEVFTCIFRFMGGLRANRVTANLVAPLTGGVRIHHGYPGVVMLGMAGFGQPGPELLHDWTIIVGSVLLLSDLAHHFLVLHFVTGNHEFDLIYPEYALARNSLPHRIADRVTRRRQSLTQRGKDRSGAESHRPLQQ